MGVGERGWGVGVDCGSGGRRGDSFGDAGSVGGGWVKSSGAASGIGWQILGVWVVGEAERRRRGGERGFPGLGDGFGMRRDGFGGWFGR